MKEILKSIYPYIFLVFIFVLPLDKYATAIPNVILICLITFFPFVVVKSDFNKLKSKEIIIFGLLVLYIIINGLLFQDFKSDIVIIQKIISALALIVLYIPINNTKQLKKTIIASVLVGIIISLYNLYFYYISEEEFNFASGAVIDDVLIVDRLYLGFLCVISIIASLGLMDTKYNNLNKWYLANITINVGFVLLISSRVAIILLLLLFILKIFYTKRKKEYLLFFIGILGVIVVSFYLNKNLQERFLFTHNSTKNVSYLELFKKWEPRVVIWECNYLVAKQENHPIKGNGFYNSQDKLTDCYSLTIEDPLKKEYFVKERFNSHNQFIDFFLAYGFIAFAMFCLLMFLLFYKNKNSYYKTALFVSLFTFSFIESYFHRQLGGYIFALILIQLLVNNNPNKQIDI